MKRDGRCPAHNNPQTLDIAFCDIKPNITITDKPPEAAFILLHPVELQRLGKLMRGGAFLRALMFRLCGDVFGKRDELLAARPIIGGIFDLERLDAELGIFFLQRLPDREEDLAELGFRESFAVEHLALEVRGALKACGIGRCRGHQARVAFEMGTLGEVLKVGDFCRAL